MSLRHVILTLLSDQPATGYDITRAFDERLSFFWTASHQQVYRDLRKMAEDGLVEGQRIGQRSKPDKIVYRLTQAGRDELAHWLAQPGPHRINNALLVKLQAIDVVGPHLTIAMLEQQRRDHVARLAQYEAIDQSIDKAGQAQWSAVEIARYAALRRGLSGERNWIEWLDETIGQLKKLVARSG